MSSSLVQIDNLHVSLIGGAGPVNILRGLDLEVSAGETLSIVGPSGAGKTTLLMVLAGLEPPTAGEVVVAGTRLNGMSEDQLARFRRRHIGIVFQSFHLVPNMTAVENVALPLEFSGCRDALERARVALEETGLGERAQHYPGQLSGGEQQRVALARAFVAEPDLILADEPTGNLDRETGARVMDLLFERQSRSGGTLLLITHDAALAQRCERCLQMGDGRLTALPPEAAC